MQSYARADRADPRESQTGSARYGRSRGKKDDRRDVVHPTPVVVEDYKGCRDIRYGQDGYTRNVNGALGPTFGYRLTVGTGPDLISPDFELLLS